MKRTIFLLFIFLSPRFLFADSILKLQTTTRLSKSFKHIEVVNNLIYENYVGKIRNGKSNNFSALQLSVSLKTTLDSFFYSIASDEKIDKELVVVVHDFFIEEYNNPKSSLQYGRMFLNAAFFIEQDLNAFQQIHTIDTVIIFKHINVQPKLWQGAADFLVSCIDVISKKTISNDLQRTFSKNDLMNFDVFQKKSIPAYQTETVMNGVYSNINDWALNKSSYPHTKVTALSPKSLTLYDSVSNENIQINLTELFAIAKNNKQFITNKFGLFELYKENNDYYFKGLTMIYNSEDSKQYTIPVGVPGVPLLGFVTVKDYKKYNEVYLYKIHYRVGILSPLQAYPFSKKSAMDRKALIQQQFPFYEE